MLNLFGIDCKTEYVPNDNVGLIYSDNEYAETFAEKREAGLVAGQPLSALLVNTALRQYCAMSYVFVKAVTDILKDVYGANEAYMDSVLYTEHDDVTVSVTESTLLTGDSSLTGFNDYLYNLTRITLPITDGANFSYYTDGDEDIVVKQAIYAEPTGYPNTHKVYLRQADDSEDNIGISIDSTIKTLQYNNTTMVNNAMSSVRNVNRKYTVIRAYTGQYNSSITKPTIAARIKAIRDKL